MNGSESNPKPYNVARELIRSADMLLFKPSSIAGYINARVGNGLHGHAGMAAWLVFDGGESRLACLDTVSWHGGRVTPLSKLVKRHPGKVEVYRLHDEDGAKLDWSAAIQAMFDMVGDPYGVTSVLSAGFRHVPVVRLVWPFEPVQDNGGLPFCSMAVSRALRAGGVDPCGRRPDLLTEPVHLAEANVYVCTLIP